jgi:hypothetical protein
LLGGAGGRGLLVGGAGLGGAGLGGAGATVVGATVVGSVVGGSVVGSVVAGAALMGADVPAGAADGAVGWQAASRSRQKAPAARTIPRSGKWA